MVVVFAAAVCGWVAVVVVVVVGEVVETLVVVTGAVVVVLVGVAGLRLVWCVRETALYVATSSKPWLPCREARVLLNFACYTRTTNRVGGGGVLDRYVLARASFAEGG